MRRRIVFTGRVQGVGFRATARDVAHAYPVTGWVRNEADGSVLLEAQGAPEALDGFLADLARQMAGRIASARAVEISEADGEDGFHIAY